MASAANKEIIQQFYIAYYGRPGDPAGVDYWADRLEAAGGVLSAVLDAFGNSAEADAQFGAGREDATRAEIEASVTDIYQQTFGRAPDAAGLDFYADGVEAGTFTLIDVAKRIVDGRTGDDVKILANKTTAANAYTDALRANATANTNYSGDAAGDVGRSWLAGVVGTDASVTAAQTSLTATLTSLTPLSFTLTTSAESITGGPVNDTISGVTSGLSAERTMTATDTITAGAGTDTLNVTLNTDFGGFNTGAGVTGVEVVNLTNNTAAARTFDATRLGSAVEEINIATNAQNFTISSLSTPDITIGITGGYSTATSSRTVDVQFTPASVDGDADSLTLELNSRTQGLTFNANGIENLTIASNGGTTASTIAAFDTDLAMESLTITGSGPLSITAVESSVETVDGSAAKGALTLGLSGATVKSVKTGSGNDAVTVNAMTSKATFDGGAGSTDTLTISGVTGTLSPTIAGFETIKLTGYGAAGTNTTVSSANISGLSTLTLNSTIASNKTVTVAGLANSSLKVNFADASTTTPYGTDSGTLILTGAAGLTVNATSVNGSATTGLATTTISTALTAANAASLDLTVADGAKYGGTITVAKASTIDISVDPYGELSGTVTAASADSVDLTIDGEISGSVVAAKATEVDISFGEDSIYDDAVLNFASAETVGVSNAGGDVVLDLRVAKATALTIDSEGDVSFDTTADLSAVQTLDITGTGSVSIVAADSLAADADSISIDASDSEGDITVTVSKYTAGSGVFNFTGSDIGKNTIVISGGRNDVEVTGGIAKDTVTFSEALTGSGTYVFNLGTISTDDEVIFDDATDLSGTSTSTTFTGVDVIRFNGSGAAGVGTLKASSVSGQELTIADFTTLTLSGAATANTIDLSDISFTPTSGITVNGGAAADVITGSDDADTALVIDGAGGADSITAGAFGDTIIGGTGADTMTGGAGSDVFRIAETGNTAISNNADGAVLSASTTLTTVNVANADVIYDFDGTDTLQFLPSVFTWYADASYVFDATVPTVDGVSVVYGTYNAASKVFTYVASYDDTTDPATANFATLVIYDTTNGVTNAYKGVVLVGTRLIDADSDTGDGGATGQDTTGLGGTGG